MTSGRPRVGFLMEQSLGHVTYAKNLHAAYDSGERLEPVWLPVPFASEDLLERLPGVRSNWAVRGSLRACAALRACGGARRFDALFINTQTIALGAPFLARGAPVIISLDATPLNFDRVGAYYGHDAKAGSRIERLKQALYRRVFHVAAGLTTWSQWAKDSLRDDYGVDPELVAVVPPGIDLDLFPFGKAPRIPSGERPLRILFVGGDFERKGGPLLLECMRDGLGEHCELDLVTSHPLPERPGVRVHRNLGPNDPRLLTLYREADVFALPTRADCLAVVLGEAMAAGLPVVTTSVGAQPEAVQEGVTGLVVPPGNVTALYRALRRLVDDPELRRAMGRRGRALAEARFDATVNARRLADVIRDGIERWRRGRRTSSSPATDRIAIN